MQDQTVTVPALEFGAGGEMSMEPCKALCISPLNETATPLENSDDNPSIEN
jgi:hypothetical protein